MNTNHYLNDFSILLQRTSHTCPNHECSQLSNYYSHSTLSSFLYLSSHLLLSNYSFPALLTITLPSICWYSNPCIVLLFSFLAGFYLRLCIEVLIFRLLCQYRSITAADWKADTRLIISLNFISSWKQGRDLQLSHQILPIY